MKRLFWRMHHLLWSLVRRLLLGLLKSVFARPLRPTPDDALVFSPHQDDETLGCGGMIAAKCAQGARVHVAFLTDGSQGCGRDAPFSPSRLAQLRAAESLAAVEILGVLPTEVSFLGYPDGALSRLDSSQEQEAIRRLQGLLQTCEPDEVFLPYRRDLHADHLATHRLVRRALAASGVRAKVFEYPIWALETPWRAGFTWTSLRRLAYLPLESKTELKRRALSCYRSQLEPQPPHGHLGLPPHFLAHFLKGYELYFVSQAADLDHR